MKKLFAVLLKLSPKETAVSLIIRPLGLLAAILGPFGNRQKTGRAFNERIENKMFFNSDKSNTGKEKAVNMSIVPDCKSLQKKLKEETDMMTTYEQ